MASAAEWLNKVSVGNLLMVGGDGKVNTVLNEPTRSQVHAALVSQGRNLPGYTFDNTKLILEGASKKGRAKAQRMEIDGKNMLVYPISRPVDITVPPFGTGAGCESKNEPCECTSQYRPRGEQPLDSRAYNRGLDDATAARIASEYAATISTSLTFLQDLVRQQGNVILKRWPKSEIERRKIVQLALPDLYLHKSPQAKLWYTNEGFAAKRPFRATWLLPYLTVENLCDDRFKFLNLLHHRIASKPDDWVKFDSEQFDSAWARGCLGLDYNAHCVVMHGGSFGKLVPWDKEAAHAWNIVDWPRAQCILEAQATLLTSLRAIAEQVMALRGTLGMSGCVKWEQTIPAHFKLRDNQEIVASFSSQPFSKAPVFDPAALLEIAQTRRSAVEDDLWLFQTEPAYALFQASQLLKLNFYKALGGITDDLWPGVAHELAYRASLRAQTWRWISQELEYLVSLKQEYPSLTPGAELPKKYALAVGSIIRLAVLLISAHVKHLRSILPTFPSIQKHYDFSPDPERCNEIQDPFFWAIYQLQFQHVEDELIGTNKAFHFAFLDEWIAAATPKQKNQVDQRLLDYITDMAGLQQIICTLRHQRPFCVMVDQETDVRTQSGRGGELEFWRNCFDVAPGTDDPQYKSAVGNATQAFVDTGYSAGQKDAAWLAHDERSRVALTAFWDVIASGIKTVLEGSGRTEACVKFEVSMVRQAHDAAHISALAAQRAMILEDIKKKQATTTVPDHFSFGLSSSHSEAVILPSVRNEDTRKRVLQRSGNPDVVDSKPASSGGGHDRGDAYVAEVAKEADTSSPEHPKVRKIEVNRESVRLFSALFGPASSAPTNIRWKQVVAALVDAGCEAFSNGGSAVTFRHTLGSIAFHRPHPGDVVHPVMLNVMGKRLRKWFGWDGHGFVEKSKVAA